MSTDHGAHATRRALLALALATTAGLGTFGLRRRARADAPRPPASTPAATTPTATTSSLSHGTGRAPPRVAQAACHATNPSVVTPPTGTHATGSAHARAAAQRGLDFVAANSTAWQTAHNCYGCHVQAVTLEALTVGRHNQYNVSQASIDTVLHGMLDAPGGAHGTIGLSYQGGSLLEPSRAFGGSAFAHYDRLIDGRVRRELLRVAEQLLEHQQTDGHVGDYTNGPVAVGPIQTTTQALETWRAAFERSADDRWLAPMRRAEAYVQQEAARLAQAPSPQSQQVGYALIGLVNAGASRSETNVQGLTHQLLEAQNADGGWGQTRGDNASVAIATGNALYALRLLGYSDEDRAVTRGTQWLIAHQGEDGGWSHSGSARGEAMWAVLGLVTTDVVSVEVQGLQDGAHIEGSVPVRIVARDNGGGTVERIDVSVDDVTVQSACGAQTAYTLDANSLGDGTHTVDIAVVNAAGQSTRRRVQVYAGAYYLTEVGSRFEDSGTTFALRDLAPASTAHQVELHVFAATNGANARGAEVFHSTQNGVQGPLHFFWNGQDAQGHAQAHGRYVAELRFVDSHGAIVQHVETPFVHDTVEAQQAQYGQVAGELQAAGRGGIANQAVDLVDAQGHVVQTVNSTATGNYMFRNVTGGNYRVRVRRSGFADAEAPVSAAPARASAASMELHAQ